MLGEGYRRGNLYYLPAEVCPVSVSLASLSIPALSLLGYHRRLNHVGLKPLKRLLKLHNISPTVSNEIEVQKCDVCVQGKMHRHPFKSRLNYCASVFGAQVHSDVCSFEEVSREGFQYFITFVDDCSKGVWVFPMKLKSDYFHFFKGFRSLFEKYKHHGILSLTTDNGGEYISTKFESYLQEHGIS